MDKDNVKKDEFASEFENLKKIIVLLDKRNESIKLEDKFINCKSTSEKKNIIQNLRSLINKFLQEKIEQLKFIYEKININYDHKSYYNFANLLETLAMPQVINYENYSNIKKNIAKIDNFLINLVQERFNELQLEINKFYKDFLIAKDKKLDFIAIKKELNQATNVAKKIAVLEKISLTFQENLNTQLKLLNQIAQQLGICSIKFINTQDYHTCLIDLTRLLKNVTAEAENKYMSLKNIANRSNDNILDKLQEFNNAKNIYDKINALNSAESYIIQDNINNIKQLQASTNPSILNKISLIENIKNNEEKINHIFELESDLKIILEKKFRDLESLMPIETLRPLVLKEREIFNSTISLNFKDEILNNLDAKIRNSTIEYFDNLITTIKTMYQFTNIPESRKLDLVEKKKLILQAQSSYVYRELISELETYLHVISDEKFSELCTTICSEFNNSKINGQSAKQYISAKIADYSSRISVLSRADLVNELEKELSNIQNVQNIEIKSPNFFIKTQEKSEVTALNDPDVYNNLNAPNIS